MISHKAYSTSQFVVHLNKASSSFGNLKTCLCAGTRTKNHHRKFASLLNKMVLNTRSTNKIYTLNSAGWKQVFHCERMVPKNKSFLQYTQRRYNSTSMSSMEEVESFLSRIEVEEDPEKVIWLCYINKSYMNKSDKIKDIYMRALLRTNQLTASEAMLRFSGSTKTLNVGGNNNPLGTEYQPLHVVRANKDSSRVRDVLTKVFLFAPLAIVIYYVMMKMTKGMMGVLEKDFLPDQSEKNIKFEDVEGVDEAKEELQEVVQFLQNPTKFESLGAKLPKGVLLIGPPGTGKTLLARAIAGEAGVPFFFVSGSEFDEMFVGLGAARIRKLFASAKKHSPCIIFIDELDAVAGKRVSNSTQPYSRMTLNQLLVELDGFDQTEGVIVIGATNFPEVLDKALIRPGRFDNKVYVTLPDVRGRINILKLYLEKIQYADSVDVEIIARCAPGFSGADLSNLVNQAALHAASLKLPLVTMEHFEWARDKIIMGRERKSAVISDQNQTLVAYHEGGHAIVAIYTKDALPVHKATIMPRGSALGYVMQLPPKDELTWSRKQLLAKMDVCMGGRVAEEMIFGENNITTGASNDMEKASAIARSMVTTYGMSDKVGTVLINEQVDKISPELKNVIESEVKCLVEEAYVRAKEILHKHSKEHKMLAEALLKYETLNSKEIDLVLKGVPLQSK